MTPNDFNSAFFNAMLQTGAPGASPTLVAGEILRRDRLRVRIFAALAVLFWIGGTAGMLLLVYALNDFVMFVRLSGSMPASSLQLVHGTGLIHHSLPWVAGGVVSLMLALLFTVLLVFSSRRATLSSINISLWQLAEQMKGFRETCNCGKSE